NKFFLDQPYLVNAKILQGCLFTNSIHLQFSADLVHENVAVKHEQPQQTGWSMVMEVAIEDPNKSDVNKDKKQPAIRLLPNSVRCGDLVCLNGARCHNISVQKNYTKYEQYICLCQIGFNGIHCELANEGYLYPRITEGGYLKFPFSNTRNHSPRWLDEYKHATKMSRNSARFQISFELRPSVVDGRRLIVYHSSEQSGLHFALTMEDRNIVFRFRESFKQLPSDLISHYHSGAFEEIRHPHVFRPDADWFQVEIGCSADRKWYIAVNGNKVERIRINGHLIDPRRKPFVGDAVEGYGIADCSSGLCDRVQCENKGVCAITSASTFECLCPLGTSGTHCQQNQPVYLPQYSGLRSYTEYKGLQHTSRSETTLEITFKPVSSEGLILYQGFKDNRRGDFLAILIRAAQVEVLFDLGSGTAYLKSPTKISLNTWHTTKFYLLGRQGFLQVDETEHVQTTFAEGTLVQLTLSQPLYLGYHPNLDQTSAHLTEHLEHNSISGVIGFKGCIQELRINGRLVGLIKDAIRGSNVENCLSHPCAQPDATCSNRAECWPDYEGFHCACPLGYTGNHCQDGECNENTLGLNIGRPYYKKILKTPLDQLKRIRFDRSSFVEYKAPNLVNMLNTPHFDIYLDLRLSSPICGSTQQPNMKFTRKQASEGRLFKPRDCLILSAVTMKSITGGEYLLIKISEIGVMDLVLDYADDLMGPVSDFPLITKGSPQDTWREPIISGQTKLHANMWHKIMLKRRGNSYHLFVNGTQIATHVSKRIGTPKSKFEQLFFGTADIRAESNRQKSPNFDDSLHLESFSGCMENIHINGLLVTTSEASRGRDIKSC
ncbi:hypothetical protein P879_00433, partial [Paragonimus westermani]